MRGSDLRTGELFSYVDLEQRVPESHPLRLIRRIVNEVLAALDGEFGKLYAAEGRPSIAPEREQRSNETHSSTTDPEAKLAKKGKGKEAKLAYTGNVMTENRNGFVVEAELRQVSGMVERETAKDMIVRYSPGAKRITVGADKGFDTADFVSDMRDFNVTPHVAQNTTNRLSAIDG